MNVFVDWWWAHKEDYQLRQLLYAYLHPGTDELLYLGKADYQSVGERMRGRHKEGIYDQLKRELRLGALRPLVGELTFAKGRRFSSAALSDVESLLIQQIKPPYNSSCIDSRISRPGLNVICRGKWWPLARRTFRDV